MDHTTPTLQPVTRTGKIARLPRPIREELNTRLEDNRPTSAILRWLNNLKDVKSILAEQFSAREITPQNLTDWRQGGYRDWLRQRHLNEQIRLLAEQAEDLSAEDARRSITDNLAALLAAELAVATQTLLAETTDPRQRWLYLRQSIKQLHQLRRGNHLALRARMELERWEIECQARRREEEKAAKAAAQNNAMEPLREVFQRAAMAKIFGGGEAGEQAADYLVEARRKINDPDAPTPEAPTEIKPNQGKSKQKENC